MSHKTGIWLFRRSIDGTPGKIHDIPWRYPPFIVPCLWPFIQLTVFRLRIVMLWPASAVTTEHRMWEWSVCGTRHKIGDWARDANQMVNHRKRHCAQHVEQAKQIIVVGRNHAVCVHYVLAKKRRWHWEVLCCWEIIWRSFSLALLSSWVLKCVPRRRIRRGSRLLASIVSGHEHVVTTMGRSLSMSSLDKICVIWSINILIVIFTPLSLWLFLSLLSLFSRHSNCYKLLSL